MILISIMYMGGICGGRGLGCVHVTFHVHLLIRKLDAPHHRQLDAFLADDEPADEYLEKNCISLILSEFTDDEGTRMTRGHG